MHCFQGHTKSTAQQQEEFIKGENITHPIVHFQSVPPPPFLSAISFDWFPVAALLFKTAKILFLWHYFLWSIITPSQWHLLIRSYATKAVWETGSDVRARSVPSLFLNPRHVHRRECVIWLIHVSIFSYIEWNPAVLQITYMNPNSTLNGSKLPEHRETGTVSSSSISSCCVTWILVRKWIIASVLHLSRDLFNNRVFPVVKSSSWVFCRYCFLLVLVWVFLDWCPHPSPLTWTGS